MPNTTAYSFGDVVTAQPTSAWTAQQLLEGFPEGTARRGLLRDRDTINDEQVCRRIRQSGYPGRGLESLESSGRTRT